MEIIYPEESYLIMGACFEVYREKGCGFLEAVYQECLEIELSHRNIPFKAQSSIGISYKGYQLKNKYTPDFTCFDKIIIELKTVSTRRSTSFTGIQLFESYEFPTRNNR
jgi:GxxExxY protein